MNISQLPHHATVASLRAALDARKPYTDAIGAAMRAGDMRAVVAAQRAMREAFPEPRARRA